MLDFTSALYLGLRHPSRSLRPWASLATGRPALLEASPDGTLAAELARLMGCESALLLPSTLHLFWDLCGMLAEERIAIHVDEGAYAIPQWGVERAAACGVPVRRFRHHCPAALSASVRSDAARGLRPVVVTDGFCPGCGRLAPLPGYLEILRQRDGLLVLDDTQVLGILGHSPSPAAPYGREGGGCLRHFGIEGADILSGSSLAKGFGVPVAVLGGSAARIDRFKQRSATRSHCSPPSMAVIRAAEHALDVNAAHGDALRLALSRRVAGFRSGLGRHGLATRGGLFPVQMLEAVYGIPAIEMQRNLTRAGVRALPLRGHLNGAVGFLFTARHRPEQIDRAVERLAASLRGTSALSAIFSFPKESRHEQPVHV